MMYTITPKFQVPQRSLNYSIDFLYEILCCAAEKLGGADTFEQSSKSMHTKSSRTVSSCSIVSDFRCTGQKCNDESSADLTEDYP